MFLWATSPNLKSAGKRKEKKKKPQLPPTHPWQRSTDEVKAFPEATGAPASLRGGIHLRLTAAALDVYRHFPCCWLTVSQCHRCLQILKIEPEWELGSQTYH